MNHAPDHLDGALTLLALHFEYVMIARSGDVFKATAQCFDGSDLVREGRTVAEALRELVRHLRADAGALVHAADRLLLGDASA